MAVNAHRRPTKQGDVDALWHAMSAGTSLGEVGGALQMSPRVISRVRRRLVRDGHFEVPRRGGARRVVWDEGLVQLLLATVEANSDYTLEELRAAMALANPGRHIPALSTIWKKLDGELITLKKASPSPQQRNTPETKEARREYVTAMLAEPPETIPIYFDETGYSLWTRRSMARSRRGEPAHVITPVAQSNVVNVLAAISPVYGWVYHEVLEESVKADRVLAFLQHLRARLDEDYPAASILLLLDNAPIHRPADAAGVFEGGLRRHRFLPPYSQFLNPIEEAFNTLKMAIKHELRMRRAEILAIQSLPWGQKSVRRRQILREALVPSIPEVTLNKCSAFYGHMLTFYVPCLAMQDIL